jgi:hypothetical protein
MGRVQLGDEEGRSVLEYGRLATLGIYFVKLMVEFVNKSEKCEAASNLELKELIDEGVEYGSSADFCQAEEPLRDQSDTGLVHKLQSQLRTGSERGAARNSKASFIAPLTDTEPFQLPFVSGRFLDGLNTRWGGLVGHAFVFDSVP